MLAQIATLVCVAAMALSVSFEVGRLLHSPTPIRVQDAPPPDLPPQA